MTFKELQQHMAPLADQLDGMVQFAETDEFAPWVVEALRRAVYYARLSDQAVSECQADFEAEHDRA